MMIHAPGRKDMSTGEKAFMDKTRTGEEKTNGRRQFIGKLLGGGAAIAILGGGALVLAEKSEKMKGGNTVKIGDLEINILKPGVSKTYYHVDGEHKFVVEGNMLSAWKTSEGKAKASTRELVLPSVSFKKDGYDVNVFFYLENFYKSHPDVQAAPRYVESLWCVLDSNGKAREDWAMKNVAFETLNTDPVALKSYQATRELFQKGEYGKIAETMKPFLYWYFTENRVKFGIQKH